ncbi:MAG: hypothetical protein Q4B31_04355 [Clostridia bacterium]|nr:hypothetical protein [Clostridia bacterium]
MKSSKLLRVAAILMTLTMLTTAFVGETFAKYVSSATSNTSSAKVAKWVFTVNETDIAKSDTFTVNLFDTIYDTDGTTPEDDVETASGTYIAPGTSGKFSLDIKNDSYVTANYTVTYNITNTKNIPIEYSIDGGTNWSSTLANVSATELAIGAEAKTEVMWRWAFEGDHTALGSSAATETVEVIVSATVTATQVD